MAKRKRKLRIRRYDVDHKLEKDILLDLGNIVNKWHKDSLEEEKLIDFYTRLLNRDRKKLNYLCAVFNKPNPLDEDLELINPYLPEIN